MLDDGTLASIRSDTTPVSAGGLAEALEPVLGGAMLKRARR
jgi:hypothetical protein